MMSIFPNLQAADADAPPLQVERGTGSPGFLCIGAQKAGTSWLHKMLSQNESIFLPPIKEIHFFDYIYIKKHRSWINNAFRRGRKKLSKTADYRDYIAHLAATDRLTDAWYKAVFDHAKARGRITGEVTPAYSILPASGVERVHAFNPNTKILFIVRDPVDRALSHLRMAAERQSRTEIRPDVLEQDLSHVIKRSAYRRNIKRWESVFPRQQILYLPYRRIRSDPQGFLREVEDFIGASPGTYTEMEKPVNKTAPILIAPEVVAGMEERLAAERGWLKAHFGEAFLS